jgi:hypothetical protein
MPKSIKSIIRNLITLLWSDDRPPTPKAGRREFIREASYRVIENKPPARAQRLYNIIGCRFGWAIAQWQYHIEGASVSIIITPRWPFITLTLREWAGGTISGEQFIFTAMCSVRV